MITKIQSADPVATYNQAIRFLEEAVEALDQAHACLKDVGMDQVISTKTWGRYVSLLNAVALTDKLLDDARSARCEDCGMLLAGNARCLQQTCCLEPDESTESLDEF
jgi:hypothetical protein